MPIVDEEKLKEQLRSLTREQLIELRDQMNKSNPSEGDYPRGGQLTPHQAGLRGMAEGALLGLQGRPLSEMSIFKRKTGTDYEELLKKEKLKNVVDPSRRMAQLELEAIEKGQKEKSGVILPEEEVDFSTTEILGGQTEGEEPNPYITIQDGFDKYGSPKYKAVKNPEYERWEKAREGKITAKTETIKMGEKSKASFKSAVAMFSGIVAQTKAQQEEQKGLGLIPGLKGKAMAGLKRPEYSRTAAAYGQRVETAMRMNSILTGQNRVIKGVVNMIFNSLPGQFDPEETAAAKITQSITNAYKITKAWERAGLTPEELNKMPSSKMKIGGKVINVVDTPLPEYSLTTDEEAELDNIIDDVLRTPMTQGRKFLGEEETNNFNSVEEAEAANLPVGTEITIRGRKAVIE